MDVSLGQLRRENMGVRGYIVVYGTNLFICLLYNHGKVQNINICLKN